VETRARLDDLRRIEGRLDIEDLADTLAANAQEYRQEKASEHLSRTGVVRVHGPRLASPMPAQVSTGARGTAGAGVRVRPTRGDR